MKVIPEAPMCRLQTCIGKIFIHLLGAQPQKFWPCPNFHYTRDILVSGKFQVMEMARGNLRAVMEEANKICNTHAMCIKTKGEVSKTAREAYQGRWRILKTRLTIVAAGLRPAACVVRQVGTYLLPRKMRGDSSR